MIEEVLKMENITKIYPNGFVANKSVNFSLRRGEIHALAGENGAGKTTLMKILFGQEKPEEGKIYFEGNEIEISSPIEAIKMGIGMVHQHFMLVPSLTVAENIMLGIEPKKGISLDTKEMINQTKIISKKYNLPVPATKRVNDISIGMKQRVEILKTLARDAKIIILDEPTAVLTPQETEELFERLVELKHMGYTIVFISHKLNEIKEICDRITIIRRGQTITTERVENLSIKDISRMMIGEELPKRAIKENKHLTEKTVLEMNNVNYINDDGVIKLNNFSLNIKAGEIVGVAGIEGNGQKELSELISGEIDKPTSGQIILNGCDVQNESIRNLRERGVSNIPEDRLSVGCAYNMTIYDNIISDRYYFKEYSKGPLIDSKKLHKLVDNLVRQYQVKCDNSKDTISLLSGGNIQKVVVAREFSTQSSLIVANQPTRGIDIGSATFIRNRLIELSSDNSSSVLLISADLDELLSISDRIIVMYEGKIVGNFTDIENLSEHILGEYMLGIKSDNDTHSKEVRYES